MSRLAPNQLKAIHISQLKEGSICDGGGLWLSVKGGSRLWEMRFKSPVTRTRRQMSLGSASVVTLAEARKRATECRRTIDQGLDPIEERKKEQAARKLESGVTFEEAASGFIRLQEAGWKDRKAVATWTASLGQYVFPAFGGKPVRLIDTPDVMAVLEPIWTEKNETASRIRSRIERILDYARAQGWRESENPARWKGHLAAMLPAPSKVAKVEHHKAVALGDINRVMQGLSASGGIAAKAVRFTCLTAARSGEVRSASWSEIDLPAKLWTIPAGRMKAGKEHRVPLSADALSVLHEVLPFRDQKAGDLVFPGHKRGNPLSDVALSKALHVASETKEVTVHGLRSTFRDWASEETDFPHEVAEMALAHTVGNKVEAAYRRGDLMEKRREMMEAWAKRCGDASESLVK
mgnify:CR=1 FL=1